MGRAYGPENIIRAGEGFAPLATVTVDFAVAVTTIANNLALLQRLLEDAGDMHKTQSRPGFAERLQSRSYHNGLTASRWMSWRCTPTSLRR